MPNADWFLGDVWALVDGVVIAVIARQDDGRFEVRADPPLAAGDFSKIDDAKAWLVYACSP